MSVEGLPSQAPAEASVAERLVGYHAWSNLLFIHWRVPAERLQPLLPRDLELDLWDGDAWVGLVPFHLTGVRPLWSPRVPGISNFHETNVRTYVRYRGGDPGVWFFSLDAASLIAVQVARWKWNLNYFWAAMRLERCDQKLFYSSRRRWPAQGYTRIEAEVGAEIAHSGATLGTLEHFLIERYLFYASARGGGLRRGRVRHHPYTLYSAELLSLEESLVAAAGIQVASSVASVLFSPGVDVEIFAPQRISPASS